MASTGEEITITLSKLITKMADESKRVDVSWDNIAGSIAKSGKAFESGYIGAIAKLTGTSGIIKNLSTSMSSAFSGDRSKLESIRKQLNDAVVATLKEEQRGGRGRQTNAYYARLKIEQSISNELAAQEGLYSTIQQTVTGKLGASLSVIALSLKIALDYSKQINVAMIQASANAATRNRLAADISKAQAATGNEMEDMAKAGAALSRYGIDLKSNFGATLETIVQMEEGLGVSYDTSAEMAMAMNRIGTSVQRVADGIARVKADTALAADEATKFATQIGKAIALLRPGSGGMAAATIEYVNRMAGALKELTGSGDDIVKMLTNFTTESGMLGSSMLGATPDFLADPAKVKKVTENFVDYVNKHLAGTSGWQRRLRIDILAQQFDTTAEMVGNASEMMAKFNKATKDGAGLQEEWRNQTSEINKTMSKLVNSGRALIQQTLLPLLQWIRPGLGAIADTFAAIAKNSYAVYTVAGLLITAAAFATVALVRLTAAILKTGWAAGIVSGLKGGVGAGMSASAIGANLARLVLAINPITAIIAVAGGLIVAAIHYDTKRQLDAMAKQETFAAMRHNSLSGSMTRNEFLQNIERMALAQKSQGDIEKYIVENMSNVKGMRSVSGEGQDPILQAILAQELLKEIPDVMNRAAVRVAYTGVTGQVTEATKQQERLIKINEDMAANIQLLPEALKRIYEQNKVKNEEIKAAAESLIAEGRTDPRVISAEAYTLDYMQ